MGQEAVVVFWGKGGGGASYVAKSESAVRVLFLVWISKRSVGFILR